MCMWIWRKLWDTKYGNVLCEHIGIYRHFFPGNSRVFHFRIGKKRFFTGHQEKLTWPSAKRCTLESKRNKWPNWNRYGSSFFSTFFFDHVTDLDLEAGIFYLSAVDFSFLKWVHNFANVSDRSDVFHDGSSSYLTTLRSIISVFGFFIRFYFISNHLSTYLKLI